MTQEFNLEVDVQRVARGETGARNTALAAHYLVAAVGCRAVFGDRLADFNLFGGQVRRFSELERSIPGVSQKMLTQQLRQLVKAGLGASGHLSSGTSEG